MVDAHTWYFIQVSNPATESSPPPFPDLEWRIPKEKKEAPMHSKGFLSKCLRLKYVREKI